MEIGKGILMEIGRGTIRSIFCQPQCVVDIVPVDYVVDTLICAAWHISNTRPQRFAASDADATCPPLRVYNCTSGSFNPVKCVQFPLDINYLRKLPG